MKELASTKRMRQLVVAAILALLVTQVGTAMAHKGNNRSEPPAGPDTLMVRDAVKYLADPAREGRGVGTVGIDSAATYLATRMFLQGLIAAGDSGTFMQRFEVTTGAEAIEPCKLEVAGKTFPLGEALQPLGFSTNGSLRGPVVFAGYGITAPGYDYDDYAGIDVHDKMVLVLTNEPGELDSTSRFEGTVNTSFSEVRTKAINAREHGALALLIVNGPRNHAGEPLRKPKSEGAGYMSSGLLAGLISDDAAAALLAGTGQTLAQLQDKIDAVTKPHSVTLPDTARLTLTVRRQRARTANVVGTIPGRDTLRAIVIGAHYDHLGYGGENSLEPNSHAPHLGADDNASGTAALLAVERALFARRAKGWSPNHTLVFCHFTGEEMGLVGSGHFVDDPPVPLETIETMINMDMVGRLHDNRLMVMGVGTAAE